MRHTSGMSGHHRRAWVQRAVGALTLAAGVCLLPRPLQADFEDLGAGARAVGMGGAFVAIADDAFGMYYNPAGLGFVRTAQIGAEFGRLYMGLDDGSNLYAGFNAIAFPLLKAQFKDVLISSAPAAPAARPPAPQPVSALPGMAAATVAVSSAAAAEAAAPTTPAPAAAPASLSVPAEQSDAPDVSTKTVTVKETSFRHLGTVALGWRYFGLADVYQESAYYLGYGRVVNNRWAYGLNVKYLDERYTMDEYLRQSPVFAFGRKNAVSQVSVDAGVLFVLVPRLFMGIAASDLNQPDMGLYRPDPLPATLRAGISWKDKDLAWGLTATGKSGRWYYATGFEKWLNRLFALRAGLGYGARNYATIAAGFSANFYRAQLDYVFAYPLAGIEDISGNHRLSFTFRFGRRQKQEIEPGSLEFYYAKLQDDLANTRQQLQETQEEKENLEKVLVEEATMRIQEKIRAARESTARAAAKAAGSGSIREVEAKAAPREQQITRHLVRKGDTLQSLAERYYGNVKYWNEIYKANRDNVGRGGVLKPNQVLEIPALSFADQGGAAVPAVSVKEIDPVPQKIISLAPVAVQPVEPSAAAAVQVVPIKIIPVQNNGATAPAAPSMKSAAPAPARPQPVRSAGPRKHRVAAGENLRSIAQKYYNNSDRWKEIYKANRDNVVNGQVKAGVEIIIP